MGVHKQDQDKIAPLAYQTVPEGTKLGIANADAQSSARAWRGHLLDCDASGWASCISSYFAPCLAWGQAFGYYLIEMSVVSMLSALSRLVP